MNFKKPKDQVIYDADQAANNALYNGFSQLKNGMMGNTPGSNIDTIQYTIQRAIGEAIRSVVENVYTGEEFEDDIGIGSKQ